MSKAISTLVEESRHSGRLDAEVLETMYPSWAST